MGKIVAIGGGEIGRKGYPVETTDIDREIVRLAGKPTPKLLFIPTASFDSEIYGEAVVRQFGNRLGCRVDVLYLIRDKLEREQIQENILSSDIIYVGGGNTLRMMRIWRKQGVDLILKQAYEQNIVLSGISAGAICWFKYGSSDSRKEKNPDAGLIRARGLDFVHALFCPHYDSEEDRKPHLKTLMHKTPGIAVAVEDCCAIEIIGDKYRPITSRDGAKAYRVYWKRDEFREERIEKRTKLLPIGELV